VRLSRSKRRLLGRLRKTPVDAIATVQIGSVLRGTAKARFRLHRARQR
jgi:hypothetical protein